MRFDDPRHQQLRRSLQVGWVFLVFVTLTMTVLMGRVIQLQWKPDDRLMANAGSRESADPLPARRGMVLDRRGHPLAVTRLGWRLFVDPQLVEDHDRFAPDLARAVNADPSRIDLLIGQNADRRYVVIDPLLDPALLPGVRALKSRAIGLEPRAVREYPQGALAGQIVGFVGTDHVGLDGAEYMLDTTLRGEDGRMEYLRDARRRGVWVEAAAYQPPTDGKNIQLTIDAVIQSIAEHELAEACTRYRAAAGQAIVMHARTGEILAMANYPPFDPAQAGKAPAELRRNRCVTDPFEPGSIFKPFVHAPATAAGVAQPDEKINCSDGLYVTDFGRSLRDATPHGILTWEQVLIQSSNIGMAKVGQRLGVQRMYEAVTAFGFGQPTGAMFPGESRGIVNRMSRWNKYSITSVPMGQEIAVTPLQMVRAFSAFANGGLMPTPSIRAEHGRTPVYQRAIDQQTADHTRLILRRVMTEGTGRRVKAQNYQLWGKTGTAQVPARNGRGYIPGAYTGSFVCGAPLRHPQLIVMVAVHLRDNPKEYYGGTVAAPAAGRIIEQSLLYLAVPPDLQIETVATPQVASAVAE